VSTRRAAVLFVLFISGCNSEKEDSKTRVAEPRPTFAAPDHDDPPKQAPSAGIAQLRRAHAFADAASDSEFDDAAKRLESALLELGDDSTADQVALRQDAADRIARLRLLSGNAAAALAQVEAALSWSNTPSLFRANLYITQADAHEALGDDAAKRRSLMHALEENSQLLTHELKTP